jgi:DNA-directed RNA polymerase specialized sigma24 family protein
MALRGAGKRVEVSDEDRRELERIVRASSSEVRMVERARIVVAASEGLTTAQIAQRVGCGERMVKKRPPYSFVGLRGCGTRRGPGRR